MLLILSLELVAKFELSSLKCGSYFMHFFKSASPLIPEDTDISISQIPDNSKRKGNSDEHSNHLNLAKNIYIFLKKYKLVLI